MVYSWKKHFIQLCPTSRDPTLDKHIRLFVCGKDVDKGIDISGFHFQALVLRTNFSVSLDKVESEGLAEGVLISCTSSKLSACESTDSRLFGVEADDDERRLSIEVTLLLDGIFDPSGLGTWKETVRKKRYKIIF